MTSLVMTDQLPLSVLLFRTAMSRELSVSDFALDLNLGPISLRQFITGKTQRPRTKTLEIIAEVLDMSVEEVRERMEVMPAAAPPFGDWLEERMGNEFSRARLGREAKVSDGALRNYLHNETLPDADQAQRMAEVLGIDPLEMAQIIIANDVAARGGQLAPPTATANARTADQRALVADLRMPGAVDAITAPAIASTAAAPSQSPSVIGDEDRLLHLWRRLHPQGRRATFHYIAELLAEG